MALPDVVIACALMHPLCVVSNGGGDSFIPPISTPTPRFSFSPALRLIAANAFLILLVVCMNTPEVRLQNDPSLPERARPALPAAGETHAWWAASSSRSCNGVPSCQA